MSKLFQKGHVPPQTGNGKNFLWLKAHVSYAGDDCLAWPFSCAQSGYGRIGYMGHMWPAHRLMCVLAQGEPPTPKHVAAHECGNGHLGCVNPRHIAWKTARENQLDRKIHGRYEGGKGNRTALAPEVIAEIRSTKETETIPQIAARLGVGRGTIEYWRRSTHEPLPRRARG